MSDSSTIKRCIERFRSQEPAPLHLRQGLDKSMFWWINSDDKITKSIESYSINERVSSIESNNEYKKWKDGKQIETETIIPTEIKSEVLIVNDTNMKDIQFSSTTSNSEINKNEKNINLDEYADSLLKRCNDLLKSYKLPSSSEDKPSNSQLLPPLNDKFSTQLRSSLNSDSDSDSDSDTSYSGTSSSSNIPPDIIINSKQLFRIKRNDPKSLSRYSVSDHKSLSNRSSSLINKRKKRLNRVIKPISPHVSNFTVDITVDKPSDVHSVDLTIPSNSKRSQNKTEVTDMKEPETDAVFMYLSDSSLSSLDHKSNRKPNEISLRDPSPSSKNRNVSKERYHSTLRYEDVHPYLSDPILTDLWSKLLITRNKIHMISTKLK